MQPFDAGARKLDPELVEAREILRAASPSVAADALRRLETMNYSVGVRFHELGADGEIVRRWAREIEREPDSADGDETLLEEVLAGQGGALSLLRFIDPVEILLPEDPPYLRDADDGYVIGLLPEREIRGRPVRGAQASRRAGVDEPILFVRSWVDASSAEPVAIELARASSSILITEEARVGVRLRAGTGAAPVPLAAHVDVSVELLADSPRRFVIDLAVDSASVRDPATVHHSGPRRTPTE